ncbi:hypothetical protein [Mycolicibacterium houstonense]|uniref:hypothetical protein n=1 Tax=Mycolicibacterium houstonense TaxID=146021 RepID=UPI003F9569E1
MTGTGSGNSTDHNAKPGPVLSSHQERKRTKVARKAAAQARAAENMRMVAAAQAAGVVPQKVTRESLGWSSERAAARALAATVAATKSPKVRAKRATSTTEAPPSSVGIGPAIGSTAQQKTGGASTLFDLVAERGLHISRATDDLALAPSNLVKAIKDCPVRFAVDTQPDPLTDWNTKCLRPPFDTFWLEYPHQDSLCGAFIKATDNDGRRLSIQYVTSSRDRSEVPLWWPVPETVKLAADGRLAYRQPALSDGRNKTRQNQLETPTSIFNDLCMHLALINEVHTRNLWSSRPDTTAQVLHATLHKRNGPVILMWGDPPIADRRGPLDDPRHAPIGHQVRGHQRRLRDGGTTWVRPHRRGDGEPEGPRAYQVKKRGNGIR